MARICPRCKKNPLLSDNHDLCPNCFRAERKNKAKPDNKSKSQPEKPKKCPYCNKRTLPPDRAACLSCRPDYKITGDPSRTADGGYEVLVQTYQNGKQVGPIEFQWQVGAGFIEAKTDAVGKTTIVIPPSGKKRQLTLHVIGSEGDSTVMELPGEQSVPKIVPVKSGVGLWANFLRGLRGKE